MAADINGLQRGIWWGLWNRVIGNPHWATANSSAVSAMISAGARITAASGLRSSLRVANTSPLDTATALLQGLSVCVR